ncbi:hypothetical protein KY363_07755 [Candidatus Woesearchaeota archaeon]|nr:hypothetical protein [Candidatus Woesearchaeota archaeon]
MNKIRPIFVMHQQGITDRENRAAIAGARELLSIAGLENIIEIRDLGVWRNNCYRNDDGSLKEYQSVDWYIQQARFGNRPKWIERLRPDQHDGDKMLDKLASEPWKRMEDHYDLVVCKEDLNTTSYPLNFIVGIARKDADAVISVNRFRGLDTEAVFEAVKTEAMHELGHVFGLPGSGRKRYDNLGGGHCTNRCVMRQGNHVPDDWLQMSVDRALYGALCSQCQDDLRKYFNNTKK